jgi:hypothetical protein
MAEANDPQNRLGLSQPSQKVTVIMSIFQERRVNRAGAPESNTFIAPACVCRQLCERQDFEGPQARRPEVAWDQPSRVIGRSCPPSAQDRTTQALVRAAHDYHQRGTIVTLLRQLGLRTQGRGQAFWDQPRQELEWLFHDAREQYEHRRISLMPRRLEDERERVTQLNALWREILSRFEGICPRTSSARPASFGTEEACRMESSRTIASIGNAARISSLPGATRSIVARRTSAMKLRRIGRPRRVSIAVSTGAADTRRAAGASRLPGETRFITRRDASG